MIAVVARRLRGRDRNSLAPPELTRSLAGSRPLVVRDRCGCRRIARGKGARQPASERVSSGGASEQDCRAPCMRANFPPVPACAGSDA